MKDPYRTYRAALTRYSNLREAMVWASSQGAYSDAYIKAKKDYEHGRVLVNRQVEKLITLAIKGELP